MSTGTRFELRASDGIFIRGKVWSDAGAERQDTVVLINGGAGVLGSTYDPLAEWLASSGYETITYDYRGIGDSSFPAGSRGAHISVLDWGSKDCAAVLDLALRLEPAGRPVVVLGHSIGCFLTGFLSRTSAVKGLIFVAGHTGYWKDYAAEERIKMFAAWHILAPLVTKAVGYFPGRRLGLPANIPKGVALEWAARMHGEFWRDSSAKKYENAHELRERFGRFQAPGLIVGLTDDPFSTAAASDRLCSLYSACSFERVHLNLPNSTPIGHFGFFRPRTGHILWPTLTQWLAGHFPSGRPPTSS